MFHFAGMVLQSRFQQKLRRMRLPEASKGLKTNEDTFSLFSPPIIRGPWWYEHASNLHTEIDADGLMAMEPAQPDLPGTQIAGSSDYGTAYRSNPSHHSCRGATMNQVLEFRLIT
jgi:hypothetical protein